MCALRTVIRRTNKMTEIYSNIGREVIYSKMHKVIKL